MDIEKNLPPNPVEMAKKVLPQVWAPGTPPAVRPSELLDSRDYQSIERALSFEDIIVKVDSLSAQFRQVMGRNPLYIYLGILEAQVCEDSFKRRNLGPFIASNKKPKLNGLQVILTFEENLLRVGS